MLKDTVEVRSLRPNQLVQTIQFPALKFLCRGGPRNLFVVCQPAANQTDLYHLHADGARVRSNVQLLINEKQYELALQLAESHYTEENASEDLTPEEKIKRVEDIKRLYAYHLFSQRRFKEAFDLYKSINTEVIYVIGLFPDFIPADVRRNMLYPGPLLNSANDLPKNDWMSGLQALTEYLSEVRSFFRCGHTKSSKVDSSFRCGPTSPRTSICKIKPRSNFNVDNSSRSARTLRLLPPYLQSQSSTCR